MVFSQKRGLSDVVTSVLLILLVLASVAILWSFLRPAITRGGQSVNAAQCIGFEIQPVSCTILKDATGAATTNASVTYKWNTGDVTLGEIKLILEKSDGNSRVISGDLLNRLETVTVNNVDFKGTPGKFTVSGILKNTDGSTTPCPEYAQKVSCA